MLFRKKQGVFCVCVCGGGINPPITLNLQKRTKTFD